MKREIIISESEKQKILNMHSNPELKRKLFEQPAFGTEKTKETETALEEQIFELERIQNDLKQTLKELEQDKTTIAGKLIPRIKNWVTKNKLKKENEVIAKKIEQAQKDIESFNSGKLFSDSEKKVIIARIGQVVGAIGVFITDMKTNFLSKAAKGIKSGLDSLTNRD
jgi:hypothetical protein